MAVNAEALQQTLAEEHEDPREHLMFDPKPRGEMNNMVMESMRATSWKFWVIAIFLAIVVLVCLFGSWGYLTDLTFRWVYWEFSF